MRDLAITAFGLCGCACLVIYKLCIFNTAATLSQGILLVLTIAILRPLECYWLVLLPQHKQSRDKIVHNSVFQLAIFLQHTTHLSWVIIYSGTMSKAFAKIQHILAVLFELMLFQTLRFITHLQCSWASFPYTL